jgi:hypothetical protein
MTRPGGRPMADVYRFCVCSRWRWTDLPAAGVPGMGRNPLTQMWFFSWPSGRFR